DSIALSMRSSIFFMIPLPNNPVVMDNHTTHHGVGTHRPPSQTSQFQCPQHKLHVFIHSFHVRKCHSPTPPPSIGYPLWRLFYRLLSLLQIRCPYRVFW